MAIDEEDVKWQFKKLVPEPISDEDLPPELVHRIKSYIGSKHIGPARNFSRLPNMPVTLRAPRKSDTKIELMCAILMSKGYTAASIASVSKDLMGVQLSAKNVRTYAKKVMLTNKKSYFLNKVFNPNPQG